MKFISEYRNPDLVKKLARGIESRAAGKSFTFMEVCGTHTMAIARFGIKTLLPKGLRLISGPGCPVCVTPIQYIDHAVALARLPNTTICTFGDMIKVPGSSSSLEIERANGADIKIVYSTLDALELAKKDAPKLVIFLGIGFETTAPTIAASIIRAKTEGVKNYSVLPACKLVLPALEAVLSGPVNLMGFILPGHVSAIIGSNAYTALMLKHKVCAVVAGFEPVDILSAIDKLVERVNSSKFTTLSCYDRVVTGEGNSKALSTMQDVFEECDSNWRGLGVILKSGLAIREKFAAFDASKIFDVAIEESKEPAGCRCGEVLTGTITPKECALFGKNCSPENPVGACMVSSEGSCAASYRYG